MLRHLAPHRIAHLHATEILDSRARPTLAVTLETADGLTVRAGVPSGASTGTREAVECATAARASRRQPFTSTARSPTR
ncbi:hypothetical protein OH768_53270 [Streptomyces sp. NBC_01622]|nr:hypothetical protein OH768_53270 [Streptomyces sp. NBC_01622]